METLDLTKDKMEKAIDRFISDLKNIRTGSANAAILDKIEIDYYGSKTPIAQMAGIKVVEGRQLLITPYDKSTLKEIDHAISAADLGLVPLSEADCIRINVPSLTEDRRKEYAKDAHKMGENAKIAIRNIRRESNDMIKKDNALTSDDSKNLQEEVQKITDRFGKKIDDMVADKTKEILTI